MLPSEQSELSGGWNAVTITKTVTSSRFAFWFVLGLLAMISLPVAFTLSSVRVSALRPIDEVIGTNPTPYGYTVSLLIFVVPIILIAVWFIPRQGIHISKRAFLWTIGILAPLGGALDFFFAQFFLTFPNPHATIGIPAPALGHCVPIEEYCFYLTGFLTALLLYLWLDGYWLRAYSIPELDEKRLSISKLVGFHPDSVVVTTLAIALALIYKRFFTNSDPGFPGYFIFLAVSVLLPSMILFPKVRAVINWRALSLTLFMIVLTSLLWEATLAMPYGWWGYQHTAMMGIYIRAWGYLPVEAVFVWLAVTYATVILYEAVKCWKSSGRSARSAFLGQRAPTTSAPADSPTPANTGARSRQ
jgi:hypothetical protein